MDHATIEAENWVERHLLGQLTAEEAARFEEHYLDCPECLEQLELTRRLQLGLREIASEEAARLVAGGLIARWLRRPAVRAALGLVLVAAIALPWLLFAPLRGERQRLAEELSQMRAPQGGVPVVALSPERSAPGEEPATRITVDATPGWIVLALEPPPEPPATYQARLLEPGGKLLWQSGPLSPDAGGRVTVSVHSSWLAGTLYLVELQGPGSETHSFAFQIQHQP